MTSCDKGCIKPGMTTPTDAAPLRVAIFIPARFQSSRYPGKPLALLTGGDGHTRPLIEWTLDAARQVPGAAAVYVATDDARIADAAQAAGAAVVMTPESCANGTERCAAAVAVLGADYDIVINLQGDALLTPPSALTALLAAMAADDTIEVATPAIRASAQTQRRLFDDQRAGRVGGTTVAIDRAGDALYFSKSVIPHVPTNQIGNPDLPIFLHIGVYAYRVAALARYGTLPESALETLEGLEQLRFLDAGIPVRVVAIADPGHDLWELNNPEDVDPIESILATRNSA